MYLVLEGRLVLQSYEMDVYYQYEFDPLTAWDGMSQAIPYIMNNDEHVQ